MKLSFMTFSCPELSLDEVLAVAKKYGYVGVEFRAASNHKHGIEPGMDPQKIKEAKTKIAESNVEAVALATSCRFADPSNAAEHIEDAKAAIELAAAMDIPVIRTFGGSYPETMTRQEATDQLIDSYKKVGEVAKQYKVYVCFETHDSWCNPHDVAGIVKAVDNQYVAINWDIMHPITHGHDMTEAFEAVNDHIKHVHVHDGVVDENGKRSLAPIDTGYVDHKTAMQLLKSIDYQGAISGEWIGWEPYDIHLPREYKALKALI